MIKYFSYCIGKGKIKFIGSNLVIIYGIIIKVIKILEFVR